MTIQCKLAVACSEHSSSTGGNSYGPTGFWLNEKSHSSHDCCVSDPRKHVNYWFLIFFSSHSVLNGGIHKLELQHGFCLLTSLDFQRFPMFTIANVFNKQKILWFTVKYGKKLHFWWTKTLFNALVIKELNSFHHLFDPSR